MDFVRANMTSEVLTTKKGIVVVYYLNTNCIEWKCVLLEAHVSTRRSFFGCRKCRAWSFLHKVSFSLQKQVKTTKTDETRIFLAQKNNRSADQQTFNKIPIESNKFCRKKCSIFMFLKWKRKYKKFLEMCSVLKI